MKFALEDVLESLNQAKIDPNQSNEVITYLEKLAEELQNERQPRTKKEFVLLSQKVDDESVGTPCWLIQVEEGTNYTEISPNIKQVIESYQKSDRPKKKETDTLEKAFRNIPKKDFSNFGIALKTKEPVVIIEA